MKTCKVFKPMLPLFSGGELGEAEHAAVEAHLARCRECFDQEAAFSQVIDIARTITCTEYRIPDSARNRIASEAAARFSRGLWGLPFPAFSLSAHPGLLAGAAAMFLALVALPAVMRHGIGPAGDPAVSTLELTVDDGVVRLAWSDGTRDAYRVYKSTDPQDLDGAEVHVVKGNVWTDNETESSPIVYYRIE